MRKKSDICEFKQPPHRHSLDFILTTAINGYITFHFETMMLVFLFIVVNNTCYRKSGLSLHQTCNVESGDCNFLLTQQI